MGTLKSIIGKSFESILDKIWAYFTQAYLDYCVLVDVLT